VPRNVIVVGVPRSGTSMVAGVFANQGYFVAEDPSDQLRTPDHHNPGGYWEAEDLIERNVEVFAAAGFPFHNTWLFDPIASEAADRIPTLSPLPEHAGLVSAYSRHAPWLWKDPRLCYTLSYWWPLMDADTTRVIVIKRDPESTYRSFIRLGWREPSQASRLEVLARIEDHMRAAESALKELEIPHEVVAYEDFGSRPAEVASRLSALLALELTADDLHFESRFDRSRVRGRVIGPLERALEGLPSGVRAAAKRYVPERVARLLFPDRFGGSR